jgi:hypothetical protein
MPSQLSDPTVRSYAIGLMLLSLAVLSILELFLSYIINLFKLILILLLVCVAGAEFLVWIYADDAQPPNFFFELDDLNNRE